MFKNIKPTTKDIFSKNLSYIPIPWTDMAHILFRFYENFWPLRINAILSTCGWAQYRWRGLQTNENSWIKMSFSNEVISLHMLITLYCSVLPLHAGGAPTRWPSLKVSFATDSAHGKRSPATSSTTLLAWLQTPGGKMRVNISLYPLQTTSAHVLTGWRADLLSQT